MLIYIQQSGGSNVEVQTFGVDLASLVNILPYPEGKTSLEGRLCLPDDKVKTVHVRARFITIARVPDIHRDA